jgi:putative SOS response-associated peptidase YedK
MEFTGRRPRFCSHCGQPVADAPAVVEGEEATGEANDLMKPIHDRMPVILDPKDFGLWLDPATKDGKALAGLLCPCPVKGMAAYPVSTAVNNPRNESPVC